ncbi:MAG: TonB family protein [Cyclobacteriaceae bacterium]|nr:TonB family protein [Cyclobacteriaceae bacterium]
MEAKKAPGKDVTRLSSLFLSLGFIFSLAMSIAMIEWNFEDDPMIDLRGADVVSTTEILTVPVTNPIPPIPASRPVVIVEVPPDEPEPDLTNPFDQGIEFPTELPTLTPPEPEVLPDTPFTLVEQPASPVGGHGAFYAYVATQLKGKYPVMARHLGIEGKVFVEFIVERNGALTDVHVVKGIGGGCDELAVKVIQSAPAWHPGKQRGQPVRQRCTLPIFFKLR